MSIADELGAIGIATVVDLIKHTALSGGQNPDEACEDCAQRSPEFRMAYARYQAYLRVTGREPPPGASSR